jgi:K+-transporting ATPase ATPase C chain
MLAELKRGVLFTIVTMVLFGGVYHVGLWAVGQVAFPVQSQGSLIRRDDGSVIGSSLVAQAFARSEYLHPRPSAVDYNTASTGGSNFGPSNPEHLELVKERLSEVTAAESGLPASQVPSEMITASGGGLDPHIPPAAAHLQTTRVAAARGIDPNRIRALIDVHTEPPTFGFLGRARVNVLELNLALDRELGRPANGQR